MARLNIDDIQFARRHIETYYDSDFFPKSEEFEALWGDWDRVLTVLTHTNVEKLPVQPPRSLPAPKAGGGYRMVHQLEPMDALVYTGIAHNVAEDIEMARVPENRNCVYSYRIALSDGSFFSRGNGYPSYIKRCHDLAGDTSWVLVADISDFYNRIYLHRLKNSLCLANPAKEAQAEATEWFLTRLNGRASQGVPVGPAASIVLSEAILSDVDQFLESHGFRFTRYVDDIRVYSDSEEELQCLQESLVAYLFDAQRLQLNWKKTRVLTTAAFIDEYLASPPIVEAQELLNVARVICDYGDLYTENELEELKASVLEPSTSSDDRLRTTSAEHHQTIMDIMRFFEEKEEDEKRRVRAETFVSVFAQGIAVEPIDLGLVRHALRRSRCFRNPVLVPHLFVHFELLGPVISDAFLYLHAVTDSDLIEEHINDLRGIFETRLLKTSQLARFWAFWYCASSEDLVKDPIIGLRIWREASVEHQALAARTSKNLSWVRSKKTAIGNFGRWQRRAMLLATEVMSRDERRVWLGSLNLSVDWHEESIKKWVLER